MLPGQGSSPRFFDPVAGWPEPRGASPRRGAAEPASRDVPQVSPSETTTQDRLHQRRRARNCPWVRAGP